MIKEKDANKEARLEALSGIQLYTLKDLEAVLGVTYRTLLTYCNSGKLKATKIGGIWKVTASNLEKFLNGEQ